jgi:hypothetical protein
MLVARHGGAVAAERFETLKRLAVSAVVLPRQASPRCDQQQLGAEHEAVMGVLQTRVREVDPDELPDIEVGDQKEPAPGTGQILTDDGQPGGGQRGSRP